jgi:hypothetical protein
LAGWHGVVMPDTPAKPSTKVQEELLLPGEGSLPHSGDVTAKERADLVVAAMRECPTMVALDEDMRRWVVVEAFSDHSRLPVPKRAEIAGISTRTAYRYMLRDDIRSAVVDVLARLTPPGFEMLRAVISAEAGKLAEALRFGRKQLGTLQAGEEHLLRLALQTPGGPSAGAKVTVSTDKDGVTTVEAEASGPLDVPEQARLELRERLLGTEMPAVEHDACQSVPGVEAAPEDAATDLDGEVPS